MARYYASRSTPTVSRRLAIGRKISEFISKSHNARVRFNAYNCFIRMIERNSDDFSSVWTYRMGVPRKRREGEEFLELLRSSSPPKRPAVSHLAVRLLWLLERQEKKPFPPKAHQANTRPLTRTGRG